MSDGFYFVPLSLAMLVLAFVVFSEPAPEPPPVIERAGLMRIRVNQSDWYLRPSSIHAVHAVSKANAERLGYKTVIYGTGYKVNTPLDIETLSELFE